MKRVINLILYSLLVLFSLSCSFKKKFPVKEGSNKDKFIDRVNYPYLYVDSEPETKFDFINTIGLEQKPNYISSQWIQIEQLGGEFYFNLSFGQGGINKLFIYNDKFYEILASGDNLEGVPVLRFTKKSETEYTIIIENRVSDNKKERTINLYIIDLENQIAVVEDPDGIIPFRFMIAQQQKYNIPILINYCKERRLADFIAFDKVDYEKLLKDRGFK